MALNFPSSPSVGDTYSFGSKSWIWNGSGWAIRTTLNETTGVEEYTFTATNGQTTFSGNDDDGSTLSYLSGGIIVFLNGVKLVDGTDYTATSGTSIVLSSGANTNDILEVLSYERTTGVTNATFQAFVANTNQAIAGAGEVSNSYLTSTYTTNTVFQQFVANTNAYIASVDLNKATWTALTSTNTAIRSLVSTNASDISDLQSEDTALWNALTSTNTAIRSSITTIVGAEVSALANSAPETLNTLNELAAALGDDANFATTVSTNLSQKLGATASVTLTGDVTGSGSFSSNSVSIALTDTNLANTNARIDSVESDVSSKVDWVDLIATNNDIQTAISDRIQVANVVSTYQTIAVERASLANTNAYIASVQTDVDNNEATELAHLANTNSYIATKLDSSSYTTADVQSKAALANTNAYIASIDSNKATWSALTSTNTAIRALTTANADEISDVWSGLTSTNTAIRSLVSTNASDISDLQSEDTALWSAITSTNTAIRSQISTEVAALANSAPETLNTLNELAAALGDDANFATTVSTNLGQKLGATASITLTGDVTGSGSFSSNSVSIALTDTNLANTNSYIASESSSLWSGITGTNTAVRLLISDRLQVANAASTYQTISIERAALANTNAYIAAESARIDLVNTNLTNTNTAIRTLVSDRIQVANVTSTYVSNTAFQSFVANTNAYIASSGGGGGGLTYTTKTANYTASSGEGILADTSGGAFTVTLPASPSEGDQVVIADGANYFATNNLTVARNGETIVNSAEDLTLDVSTSSTTFVYDGSTWQIYIQSRKAIIPTNLAIAYNEYSYVANTGQTTFSGADRFGETLDYTVNGIGVFLNGLKLVANTDYTASGSSIVLNSAASNNDILEVQSYKRSAGVTSAEFNTFVANTNSDVSSLNSDISYLWTSLTNTNTAIRLAITSEISSEISNLVDSAPGALDTLNELAAALGDDPNFATTVTNSLATKASTGKAIAMSIVFG